MSRITYPPLYAAVFALQAVAVAMFALVRQQAIPWGLFVLAWTVLLGAALIVGFSVARRLDRVPGWLQFLPIATLIASAWIWNALFGPTALYVIAALGVVAGRNALLATRRQLYFDLAIVLAVFYDSASAGEGPLAWVLGVAFLLALVFVLMADYSDRRLAFVRADDEAAQRDLVPGLRNALFAALVVIVLSGAIYAVMPQPPPLRYGIPYGQAPANFRYDKAGPPSSGGEKEAKEGSGAGKGALTRKGAVGFSRHLDVTGSGGLSRGGGEDEPRTGSEGDGPSSGSKAPGESGSKKNAGESPLVLFYVDADRPLYLRVRAYATPRGSGWDELPGQPRGTVGEGRFFLRTGVMRNSVLQRIRVNQDMDDRLAAAYRPELVSFPSRSLLVSSDYAMTAPAPLVKDTFYAIRSELRYLGDRPSGDAEFGVAHKYYVWLPAQALPRVRALVSDKVQNLTSPRARAEALEGWLRMEFRQCLFNSRNGDPTERFLFETRCGGSEQFASTLALMLRVADIPSRVIGGYRGQRLNPLHGEYEIWRADRHHWVEAFIENSWVLFEPSPWAALPAKSKPANSYEAAKEYVRLAGERPESAPKGELGEFRSPLPNWYENLVLAWGWLATFGPWVLAALIGAAVLLWRLRRWLRPLMDWWDLARLELMPDRDPKRRVILAFATVERMCVRRDRARAHTENHAEYLGRLAVERPHLGGALRAIAEAFSRARYGGTVADSDAARAAAACREVAVLLDERVAAVPG